MNDSSNEIEYICFIDTLYVLLIYLICYRTKCDKTFFVVSSSIPDSIKKNLKVLSSFELEQNLSKIQLLFYVIKIRLLFFTKWKYLKNKELVGQDHLWFVSPFLASSSNEQMTVIEDGLGNYVIHDKEVKFKLIKTLFFGKLRVLNHHGKNKLTKEVILTKNSVLYNKKKAKIVDLHSLWKNLDVVEQEKILDIFKVDFSIKNCIQNKEVLLITQPLSEDGIMSEDEKIHLYQNSVNEVNHEKLVVKTHPREKTEYDLIFPNALIIKKKFPIELLAFMGVSFTEAITYFSTGIFAFDNNVKKTILNKEFMDKLYLELPDNE